METDPPTTPEDTSSIETTTEKIIPTSAGTDEIKNVTAAPEAYADFPTFYTPIYVLTAVFGAIFIIGPFLVRKNNEYRGIIRTCIMLTAFCMWIFWVTIYISQMNPLIGPRLRNFTIIWMAYKWGYPANGSVDNDPDKLYDD